MKWYRFRLYWLLRRLFRLGPYVEAKGSGTNLRARKWSHTRPKATIIDDLEDERPSP